MGGDEWFPGRYKGKCVWYFMEVQHSIENHFEHVEIKKALENELTAPVARCG